MIEVGQKVWVEGIGNNKGFALKECEVTKVGRLYFYVQVYVGKVEAFHNKKKPNNSYCAKYSEYDPGPRFILWETVDERLEDKVRRTLVKDIYMTSTQILKSLSTEDLKTIHGLLKGAK